MLDKDGVLIDNLYVTQSADWAREYPVTDPVTGVALDPSGWTIEGVIRPYIGSETKLYEWKTANSNVATHPSGKITISVPATDSSLWLWADLKAVYDLRVTNGSGKKAILARGSLTVRRASTR
jgi:hypothetical protein